MSQQSFMKTLRTGAWHFRQGGFSQVKEWRRRSRGGGAPEGPKHSLSTKLDYPEFTPIQRKTSFPHLTAAVILDDFSLTAWGPEFNMVEITPQGWREELAKTRVDFLFVESAWAGNHGAWQYHLTGSSAPRPALVELLEYCKGQGIPSVFWNKEDPPHFEDFLDTAKLFDQVFTSDSTMIPEYRKRLGHDRVETLSFAAQPAIHNPVRYRGLEHQNDMAFAGMYFAHKYPERREQMQLLLNAAVDVTERGVYDFDIFSRHHGGDEKYQFPEPFDKHVVGALPYEKMLTAYRNYKVFLNVNSVTTSPSMCARRVFEIVASGTPVVSTESAAIPQFFDQNEVPIVDDRKTAAWTLRSLLNSSQLRDRMVHKAQRKIWDNHTYTHRTVQILEALGLPSETHVLKSPSVTAIVSTNRPQYVHQVIDSVARQKNIKPQLALLTHGFDIDEFEVRAYAREQGIEDFILTTAPSSDPLGACLNQLIDRADGDVLAKFDDDDYYAPFYLHDSLNSMRISNADLVGKRSVYMYSEQDDLVLLREPVREHMFTDFVAGATFVGTHDLFSSTKFSPPPRGEDSTFLKTASSAGATIYSGDRFNFLQMRSATSHTWNVANAELYANGIVESYGSHPNHVLA